MAVDYLQIDTDKMKSDLTETYNLLKEASKSIDDMYSLVGNLNEMWSGPANAAFVAQFNNDYSETKKYLNSIHRIIDKLSYECDEYNKCEHSVVDIVAAVSI